MLHHNSKQKRQKGMYIMEQTAEQVKELLLKQGEELEQEIIGFRREIHENPETGKSLPRTKEFVMKKLREFGYEPREICESGIVAEISGPNS